MRVWGRGDRRGTGQCHPQVRGGVVRPEPHYWQSYRQERRSIRPRSLTKCSIRRVHLAACHHHHHHISFTELGHLLTRSGLTYPEVSSKVYHDSFCQLDSSVSLPWVIHFEAFYLHVVSSFSCIPVICPKLVLFLTPLQFVHLFCNLSKCIGCMFQT